MRNSRIDIVYEDNHLLVVSKPSGMLVQGDQTGDKTLLDFCKEYIAEKYQKPGKVFLAPVNRIDRPVSGLVIFARTSKAAERMHKQFLKKDVHKQYWAIIKNKPKERSGVISHWLLKDGSKNVVQAFDHHVEGAKKATTHYKLIGKKNYHHLIQLNPVTGRPHQLRAQLAAIGCPIRGDIKYGFDKPNEDKSINLHAKLIKFDHPVKNEPVMLQAGLPDRSFWDQFLDLENLKDDPRVKDKYLDKLH